MQQLLNVGEFVHCEFYLPCVVNEQFPDGVSVSNFSCHCMTLYATLAKEYYAKPDLYSGVKVELDEEEYGLLLNYLFTLAARETPYNYIDLMWQMMPSKLANVFVTDSTKVDSKSVCSLYCAQAMLLALRQCLKPSLLRTAIADYKDRTVLPQQIYDSAREVSVRTSKVRLLSFSTRGKF
jgi:hypothetical protein